MIFRNHQHSPSRSRRHSDNSDSDFDSSDGEDIPDSVVGTIEIPKSPSLPVSPRKGSTPGMKAPSHISFSSSPQSPSAAGPHPHNGAPRQPHFKGGHPTGKHRKSNEPKWPQQLYKQWFGAITEGRSIQVHSMLADYPEVLNMRRVEPTPFHMALTHIASEWLGNDTTGMDGLQVAIMGYKNAYANWRLGNGPQSEQMSGMSADQMKEHVAVREVILGALIDAISPEQLDTHFFGRQNNTTLHLAAFYNDANLVERLLRQGAAVDVHNRMGFVPASITNDKPTLQWLAMYQGQVRGTRYQSYPPQPQMHALPAQYYPSEEHEQQNGAANAADTGSSPVAPAQQFAETELEMETLEQFSDDEDIPIGASYIQQTVDQDRSGYASTGDQKQSDEEYLDDDDGHDDTDGDDAESDAAEQSDSVSLLSSTSDRNSLGLGGSRASLAKKSHDNIPLQKKIFDKKRGANAQDSRPLSLVSTDSTGDGGEKSRPRSSSNAASMLSFHTTGTATGDDTDYLSAQSQISEMSPPLGSTDSYEQFAAPSEGNGAHGDPLSVSNRTVRIKVDPNSIDDQDIEDIFSDTDEVVQHEPSFCHSGSGLSDSDGAASPELTASPSKRLSLASSVSSSSSIKMQSLAMALSKASIHDVAVPAPIQVSAFPVSVQSTPPHAQATESTKHDAAASSLATDPPCEDDASQRPTSPFSLRESLYEMIMGRPASTSSLASRSSTNSNSVSSSSTVGLTKDASSSTSGFTRSQAEPAALPSTANRRALNDGTSRSPSLTPTPSPTREVSFGANQTSATAQVRSDSRSVAADLSGLSLNGSKNTDSSSDDSSDDDDDDTSDSSSRSASPTPAPRPTAISLFTIEESPEQELGESIETEPEVPSHHEQQQPSSGEDVAAKPSRIGRRQGRVTAGMLSDDASGFISEPVFSLASSKISTGSLTDNAAKTDTNDAEKELSFMDEPSLSPDVPLTRDKRDQYLQTLISRNTISASGSVGRSKARAAIAAAMRATSPTRSLAEDAGLESGDDGDEEDNTGSPFAARKRLHIPSLSSAVSEAGGSRSPSVLGNRDIERAQEHDVRPRSSASNHAREALAVSGASINGRIRANTLNSFGLSHQPAAPTTPQRKVSPSLANLKNRGLVSLSPARLVKGSGTEQSAAPPSPARQLNLKLNRTRAMSTPPGARPPPSLLPAGAGDSSSTITVAALSGANSARIGRVAALSQNFERQATAGPSLISIPARANTVYGFDDGSADKGSLGLLSAPVDSHRPDIRMPVTRSTSMSSSHSRNGQEQVPPHAGSNAGRGSDGTSDPPPPPPPPHDNSAPSGGAGASGSGNGDGQDGDEPSPRQGPSATGRRGSDASGSTSSSHNSSLSTSHGLAAYAASDSCTALYSSGGSGDRLGSSIFSSSDSKENGSKNLDAANHESHRPVPLSREEAQAERKRQFKELAARRKSGTLEKISNSGLVKTRKALFASSDPNISSPSSRPSIPSTQMQRTRAQFEQPDSGGLKGLAGVEYGGRFRNDPRRPMSLVVESSTSRFFRLLGEEHGHRVSADDEPLTSHSGDELNLDDLQKASSSALHPAGLITGVIAHNLATSLEANTSSLVGRDRGSSSSNIAPPVSGDVRSVESRSDERLEPVTEVLEDIVDVSRSGSGSSSYQSKGNSGSGDDSLNFLSSFEVSSTPDSNGPDSVPENTTVGLLAQYNMNQRKLDNQLKRMSVESGLSMVSSGQESQPVAAPFPPSTVSTTESDLDLGFRTVSDDELAEEEQYSPTASAADVQAPSGDEEDPLSEGFHTIMPMRPRVSPQAVFGLSTVMEEEEESRNPSVVTSNAQRQPEPMPGVVADSPVAEGAPSVQQSPGSPVAGQQIEMQERRQASSPPKGLRGGLAHTGALGYSDDMRASGNAGLAGDASPAQMPSDEALHPHSYWRDDARAASAGTPTSSIPVPFSSAGVPALSAAAAADDDAASHTFDPSVVFGYTSEENSTMASRSSFDRSDVFNSGRPSSSASRVMYMQPMDCEDAGGSTGDSEGRANLPRPSREQIAALSQASGSRTSPYKPRAQTSLSSVHREDGDGDKKDGADRKGKAPAHGAPEMQQITPTVRRTEPPVTTIEEIENDLSEEEEPIDMRLFLESQDFEGYVPIGFLIQQDRDERRERRRQEKDAAKKGIALPPPKATEMISPLLTMPNNYYEPLPPESLRWLEKEQERLLMTRTAEPRVTEHPELKRALESPSISSTRLQSEFDETMGEASSDGGSAGRGTIKPLSKRARQSDVASLFAVPDGPAFAGDVPESSAGVAEEAGAGSSDTRRKSFLDDLELPTSNVGSPEGGSANSSDASLGRDTMRAYGELDEAFFSPISQEFQTADPQRYADERKAALTPGGRQTARRKLVLRTRAKSFSERMMEEFEDLDVKVKRNVHGDVREHSAGRFSYGPQAGTVRPSMIPQYVSQLNGVPAGPFFKPPEASTKSGYLYMKILSIEELEDKTDSVYFVIRNGVDTLATTPVSVGGAASSLINQEFRILTDPNVSVTMWMRFRSDAIIYANGRGGSNYAGRRMADPGCMPPLFKKLIRRNTRSRNNKWNCARASDSVFDFSETQSPRLPGARRSGATKRASGAASDRPFSSEFPERVSSAYIGSAAGGYAADQSSGRHANNAYDPRSLNATQAPSSVFYEPGGDLLEELSSKKGLVQAKFKEETRGVAVVHVGEMIEEVFLRGLVDSWDVENVWESRKGARLQLQLFFIPECPLFREEELPKTLSECEMAMEICSFHNRTLTSGFLSQRGGDTRFWRRRYFRLIGGFLFAYHEDTREPRCFIDLNDATRIIDHQAERAKRVAAAAVGFGNPELLRSMRMRRRHTHKRNNSDHSSRDGASAGASRHFRPHVPGHEYASDSEPAESVDIADPILQRSSIRRTSVQKEQNAQRMRGESDVSRSTNDSGARQSSSSYTDSGIVSIHPEGGIDSGMQHSFSIEFGEGGFIEFYAETEEEKRVWVDMIKRVIGNIPKIPSWLIKLLHADVSERIEAGSMSSQSSLDSVDAQHQYQQPQQQYQHQHQHQQASPRHYAQAVC
ncbi:hypothetical protein GQ54DRAFT_309715 [Martensiomyces pterosporus]|nr:hypothetical protein GQ54DRAFT_309715 [Martensiomyces pterosporus]